MVIHLVLILILDPVWHELLKILSLLKLVLSVSLILMVMLEILVDLKVLLGDERSLFKILVVPFLILVLIILAVLIFRFLLKPASFCELAVAISLVLAIVILVVVETIALPYILLKKGFLDVFGIFDFRIYVIIIIMAFELFDKFVVFKFVVVFVIIVVK